MGLCFGSLRAAVVWASAGEGCCQVVPCPVRVAVRDFSMLGFVGVAVDWIGFRKSFKVLRFRHHSLGLSHNSASSLAVSSSHFGPFGPVTCC